MRFIFHPRTHVSMAGFLDKLTQLHVLALIHVETGIKMARCSNISQ